MNNNVKELKSRLHSNTPTNEVSESKAGYLVDHIISSTIGKSYNITVLKKENQLIYLDVNGYELLITIVENYCIDNNQNCICWELDWLMDNDTYYIGSGYAVVDTDRCVVVDSCRLD